MVCHKLKIIFIHIPKTAGSSINKFLLKDRNVDWRIADYDIMYGWCPKRRIHLQHATPLQLLEMNLITLDQWNEYFKFTFIRNPWDRAYSDYLWMMKDRKVKDSFSKYLSGSGKFEEFISDRSSMAYRGDHLIAQTEFLKTKAKQNLDFIGRFENFNQDINILCKKLNLKWNSNIHEKKSDNKKKHYSYFYSASMKKLVEEKFNKDIIELGYTFTDKKVGIQKLKNFL